MCSWMSRAAIAAAFAVCFVGLYACEAGEGPGEAKLDASQGSSTSADDNDGDGTAAADGSGTDIADDGTNVGNDDPPGDSSGSGDDGKPDKTACETDEDCAEKCKSDLGCVCDEAPDGNLKCFAKCEHDEEFQQKGDKTLICNEGLCVGGGGQGCDGNEACEADCPDDMVCWCGDDGTCHAKSKDDPSECDPELCKKECPEGMQCKCVEGECWQKPGEGDKCNADVCAKECPEGYKCWCGENGKCNKEPAEGDKCNADVCAKEC